MAVQLASTRLASVPRQACSIAPVATSSRSVPCASACSQPRGSAATQAPAFLPARYARSRVSVRVEAAAKTANTKIIIQGRRLEVTEAIKNYIQEKLSKAVVNYQQILKEVDVTLSARGGDTGTHGKKEQKVEVTMYTLRNGVVRVEDVENSLYAAIDLVCDKVARKLAKVKEIAINKGKWPGRAGPHEDVLEEDFQEYVQDVKFETQLYDKEAELSKQFAELNKSYPATIMRKKQVELDPLSVEEAIDAMEAVGHDFFVFREMESDNIQVVYKRDSGGYGIIVPHKRD